MYRFKGIRAYSYIATLMLVMQMLKLTNFTKSMEGTAFVAVFLTIVLTIKLAVFDKKMHNLKYWLLIGLLLAQEIILGLDHLLPIISYNIAVMCVLDISLFVLYCLETPSIRLQMDEDVYDLKRACALLTFAHAIAVSEIMLGYIYPPHLPI